jgi:Outer membrane receptor proteins, mostly Fe transport
MNACYVRSRVLRALIKYSRPSMGALLALTMAVTVGTNPLQAQSNAAGGVYGNATAGTSVTVENIGTGFRRSVTVGSDGTYRVGSLPPGSYRVTYTDAAGTPQTHQVDVNVGTNTEVSGDLILLEKYTVSGLTVNPIDFTSSEAVTVFNERQIDILPIARSQMSVALLAPGTTRGDSAFGDNISFGGASVAENAYFVNGFNISNFRNGLDPALVPFEFYSNFEVKTGAYSAEFGRSTGGVINATTKSGSNEYHAGANFYWEPNEGRWRAPSSYYTTGGALTPYAYNGADTYDSKTANVFASGPLWKNKLFFYGIYQVRDIEREDIITNSLNPTAGTMQYRRRSSDDPFWGIKIDAIPFQGHRFDYTGFRDERRTTDVFEDWSVATRSIVPGAQSTSYSDRGGTTHIGRYTGTFGERFTISALYGKSEQNLTDSGTEDALAWILDGRGGNLVHIQGNVNGTISQARDEREAMRLDLEYTFDLFGSHRLRAGLDNEDNLSLDQTSYSGGLYYRYYDIPANRQINGAPVPDGVNAAVRSRVYENGGSFQVKSEAWYVEDNWSLMSDRLNLRLGVRNESFENLDAQGNTFIEVTDQIAPRLGVAYDLFGDKKTKLFFNWGRYHLPVASNTNVRLAGGEYFTEEYYALTSVGADGKNPVLGAKIGETVIYSDGSVHDRREIVDMDIAPMYQDEWVVGVQRELTKNLTVGVRGTQRAINATAMDDLIIDHALNAWAHRNGFPDYDASGAHAYVLANPGRPIRMFWDFNENGSLDSNEEAVLTPEDLQYPAATRKYYAVELFAEKVWDGKWHAQVSYTWSQSYGNYEGWVLSDNGQDDAGITQLFDSPLLTSNTYGRLPNDRRHTLKAFGSYAINSEWTIGANLLIESGRPINKIGVATELDPAGDEIAGNYGASYLLAPRGSVGRTDTQFITDLSVVYRPKWANDRLTFGVTVFNLFNNQAATEVVEYYQNAAGGLDPTYGTPSAWVGPRTVRLSVELDF